MIVSIGSHGLHRVPPNICPHIMVHCLLLAVYRWHHSLGAPGTTSVFPFCDRWQSPLTDCILAYRWPGLSMPSSSSVGAWQKMNVLVVEYLLVATSPGGAPSFSQYFDNKVNGGGAEALRKIFHNLVVISFGYSIRPGLIIAVIFLNERRNSPPEGPFPSVGRFPTGGTVP